MKLTPEQFAEGQAILERCAARERKLRAISNELEVSRASGGVDAEKDKRFLARIREEIGNIAAQQAEDNERIDALSGGGRIQ